MITYGVLYANGNDFNLGLDVYVARRMVENDERKGYICQVVRYVNGELDLEWEDD